ncbi:MAG TPA: hypothetical protein VGC29_04195 [Flavisolibacter sp.]
MRKHLLFLFFLPLLAFGFTDWVTVDIDEKVSASFPSQPEKQDMGGNPALVSKMENGNGCMSMVIDFSAFGMDSAMLADEMGKPESFEQFRESFLSQIPTAKLISEKNTKALGRTCYEFVVEMNEGSGTTTMYNKNIIEGTKMYSFNFYDKNNNSEEDRNKFLNSIRIK